MATDETSENDNASAGHKLGQAVGDWFAKYFVYPLLADVAKHLRVYLDSAYRVRAARGDKLLWSDEEGNSVDYDFVMEVDGKEDALGIPVAFFECFWRRGSRHSKDKARDDSGKLLPMRQVHPTARFLGIVAAGDFTAPARQLITSRNPVETYVYQITYSDGKEFEREIASLLDLKKLHCQTERLAAHVSALSQ